MDLETLASEVAPYVGEHGVMSVDSVLVGARANLQDMIVSFLHHAPRATESITVPSSGRPRSRWQRSNSHFVAVNVLFEGFCLREVRSHPPHIGVSR